MDFRMPVPLAEVSPSVPAPSPTPLGRGLLGLPIPPERVGINGEYDHHGLAKRVRAMYEQHFCQAALAGLRVRQRGSVIVLWGTVPATLTLEQLIEVALAVEGATHVDVHTVTGSSILPR